MPCTTILVGKLASNDGSTIIARNDDGSFEAKKIIIVEPSNQPKKYKCVISHLEIELPDNPLRYSSAPSVNTKNGLWPACGINSKNVAMTATETITTNPRVIGADPLVVYKKEEKNGDITEKEVIGGIGEEDLVTLILPYISSAREGVIRLKELLEKYGTYELNGIAFSDESEIWWVETIGGHHFIAKRVPDDKVVIMPNQFGLDNFDFNDAYTKKENHICSDDLLEFVKTNNLNLGCDINNFNPRLAFGSKSDADHLYNTPRAWYLARYLAPKMCKKDRYDEVYSPVSDDIPWCITPESKVTIEDVKYLLSSHYQGTPYDPYAKGNSSDKGKYRSIGVPNTDVCGILQIRNNVVDEIKAIEWISMGGGAFTSLIPLYTNVSKMPEYISGTKEEVSTSYLYWSSRLLSILTDAHYTYNIIFDERYQKVVFNEGHRIIHETDLEYMKSKKVEILELANEKICQMLKNHTDKTLSIMVQNATNHMKTKYNRSDN